MKSTTEMNERHPLPDEDIIQLYWNREERAIEETDVKYGKYLYTIAYNIVHDHMDCEECLNDTYLGTWNQIPPTRPTIFHVFLSRITRNVAVDTYRKKSAEKRIPSELVVSLDELQHCLPDSTEREDEFIAQLGGTLSSFLRNLDEQDEFLFVCRYYYSDDLGTIANMLQTSKSTVYRRLAQLREELAEILKKEGRLYE